MHAITQYSRPYTSLHRLHAQHVLKSILRIWAVFYFSVQNYFKSKFWPLFIRTYCLECCSVLRSNVFRFQFDFAELSDYLFLHCVLQNPPFCIVNAVTEKTGENNRFSQDWCKHKMCVWRVTHPYITRILHMTRVKSKETVGNSWSVLKVILGHKHHHNH